MLLTGPGDSDGWLLYDRCLPGGAPLTYQPPRLPSLFPGPRALLCRCQGIFWGSIFVLLSKSSTGTGRVAWVGTKRLAMTESVWPSASVCNLEDIIRPIKLSIRTHCTFL